MLIKNRFCKDNCFKAIAALVLAFCMLMLCSCASFSKDTEEQSSKTEAAIENEEDSTGLETNESSTDSYPSQSSKRFNEDGTPLYSNDFSDTKYASLALVWFQQFLGIRWSATIEDAELLLNDYNIEYAIETDEDGYISISSANDFEEIALIQDDLPINSFSLDFDFLTSANEKTLTGASITYLASMDKVMEYYSHWSNDIEENEYFCSVTIDDDSRGAELVMVTPLSEDCVFVSVKYIPNSFVVMDTESEASNVFNGTLVFSGEEMVNEMQSVADELYADCSIEFVFGLNSYGEIGFSISLNGDSVGFGYFVDASSEHVLYEDDTSCNVKMIVVRLDCENKDDDFSQKALSAVADIISIAIDPSLAYENYLPSLLENEYADAEGCSSLNGVHYTSVIETDFVAFLASVE